MSEIKLQAACFQWFWNNYPEHRGLLYMNYNNAKNKTHGAILKAIGMVAGVADLTLLTANGAVFIELKTEAGKQSQAQIAWCEKVRQFGYEYHIVRTLEEFHELVRQRMAR